MFLQNQPVVIYAIEPMAFGALHLALVFTTLKVRNVEHFYNCSLLNNYNFAIIAYVRITIFVPEDMILFSNFKHSNFILVFSGPQEYLVYFNTLINYKDKLIGITTCLQFFDSSVVLRFLVLNDLCFSKTFLCS